MTKSQPSAAQTALGPMVVVACDQYLPAEQRLVHDEVAASFLPAIVRGMLAICRWPFGRRFYFKMTEKRAPGVWGGVLCRKRYIDDCLTAASARGIDRVVILGAGLDTRAYRADLPAGTRVYEVDLPVNVAEKHTRVVSALGRVPQHVVLVPVDFDRDDLGAALAGHGFEPARPTLFIWEGVTQYLAEPGVRATLEFLAGAAPGSELVFTFVLEDFIRGTSLHAAEKLYAQFVEGYRVWHFGLPPDQVAGLLRGYGWDEQEQVGHNDYVARYLTPRRLSYPVMAIERASRAVKLA